MAETSQGTPKDGYLTYADGHRMIKNFAKDNADRRGTDDYYVDLLDIIDKHNLANSDYLVSFLRQIISERIDEIYDMSFVEMNNDKAESLIDTLISFL